MRKTKAPSHREVLPSIPYKLTATSIDHPGIVHQICKVLTTKAPRHYVVRIVAMLTYSPARGERVEPRAARHPSTGLS